MDPDDAVKFTNEAWEEAGYNRRAIPPTLLIVHLVGWLDYEVNLGGVYGWLINMGEYGPDTVKALETLGAHQCAAIVREILAFFPGSTPSAEDRERVRQMEAIGEIGEKSWRDLGNRLLKWPDDIYVLLQKFIDEHHTDFS